MLSYRIAFLRKKYHMSQSQLAAALNISPSTLGMYEQGRRIPSLETIVKIADLFCVSLDYLINGREYSGKETDITNQIPDNCPCKTCYWKEYRGK